MNLDECIEHYEYTGYPHFKTYDKGGLTIKLVLAYNHPYFPLETYSQEVVGGQYKLIAPFEAGDDWQID